MQEIEIVETVRDVVTTHARVHPEPIESRHLLTADLGFDSLAFLQTVTDLEDRLGIQLPIEGVESLHDVSFGDLVRWVTEMGGPPSGSGSRG